jgi:flagellar protein FliO/FliZ
MTGASPAAAPLSAGSLVQLTLSLAVIVGLILAIGWVMKRLKMASPRGRGRLAVIDEVAVGPRERIVLVRVGASQVLVCIGTGGIVGLTPLERPIVLEDAAPPAVFADKLREFLKRPGSAA